MHNKCSTCIFRGNVTPVDDCEAWSTGVSRVCTERSVTPVDLSERSFLLPNISRGVFLLSQDRNIHLRRPCTDPDSYRGLSMLEGFFKFYSKFFQRNMHNTRAETESPFVLIYKTSQTNLSMAQSMSCLSSANFPARISEHSPMPCNLKSTSQAPEETLENVCNSFTIMAAKQDPILIL